MRYFLQQSEPFVDTIVRTCYPDYKGRKIILSDQIPTNLKSWWDGGSKDYYCFYELNTGKVLPVASNHPMFEADNPRELKELPEDVVLVEHAIFCGKDVGITIYIRKDNLVKLLPKTIETATEDEKIVLLYTRSLKNSYGGVNNIRFKEAYQDKKITLERWEQAKQSCIEKGWLSKVGAITASGKNIVEGKY